MSNTPKGSTDSHYRTLPSGKRIPVKGHKHTRAVVLPATMFERPVSQKELIDTLRNQGVDIADDNKPEPGSVADMLAEQYPNRHTIEGGLGDLTDMIQSSLYDESTWFHVQGSTPEESRQTANLLSYYMAAGGAMRGDGVYPTREADEHGGYSIYIDYTKSSSDDFSARMHEYTENIDVEEFMREGSPVRKTDRSGADTKGTRAVEGLGGSNPTITHIKWND